jgi:hypothetical protein
VAVATPRRSALVSGETKESLLQYLAFRHFFRQAYATVLRWEEMRHLVLGATATWERARAEAEAWLED